MSLPTTPVGPQERTRERAEPLVEVITIRPETGVDDCPAWFKAARPVAIDDDPTWQDDHADSSG